MDFRKFFGLENTEKREMYTSSIYGDSLIFGGQINNYSAMNISAAYRCTELISDSVATLPILVKQKDGKGKTNVLKDHVVNLLFSDKNNRLSKYNFIKLIIQSVILRGNGFAYIERKNGIPVKLRFLESGDVSIDYNKERDTLQYKCSYAGGVIKPENMLHFVKNSYNGVNGVSLLTYAKRTIELSNQTENAANNFFSNGCNLNGILKVNSQLSEKQREQILTSWNSAYSDGGRGLAVLQGNMEYQPISLNASDSQMLESRQQNTEDVCRFFGVNPVLLGLANHSSYASLEMVQQDFLVHTLMPYIVMLESEFERKLLNDAESNLKIVIDTNGVLRSDKAAQATYYTALLNSGILTINEIRKELGYNSVDGGDENRIPFTDITQNTINKDKTDDGERNKKSESTIED